MSPLSPCGKEIMGFVPEKLRTGPSVSFPNKASRLNTDISSIATVISDMKFPSSKIGLLSLSQQFGLINDAIDSQQFRPKRMEALGKLFVQEAWDSIAIVAILSAKSAENIHWRETYPDVALAAVRLLDGREHGKFLLKVINNSKDFLVVEEAIKRLNPICYQSSLEEIASIGCENQQLSRHAELAFERLKTWTTDGNRSLEREASIRRLAENKKANFLVRESAIETLSSIYSNDVLQKIAFDKEELESVRLQALLRMDTKDLFVQKQLFEIVKDVSEPLCCRRRAMIGLDVETYHELALEFAISTDQPFILRATAIDKLTAPGDTQVLLEIARGDDVQRVRTAAIQRLSECVHENPELLNFFEDIIKESIGKDYSSDGDRLIIAIRVLDANRFKSLLVDFLIEAPSFTFPEMEASKLLKEAGEGDHWHHIAVKAKDLYIRADAIRNLNAIEGVLVFLAVAENCQEDQHLRIEAFRKLRGNIRSEQLAVKIAFDTTESYDLRIAAIECIGPSDQNAALLVDLLAQVSGGPLEYTVLQRLSVNGHFEELAQFIKKCLDPECACRALSEFTEPLTTAKRELLCGIVRESYYESVAIKALSILDFPACEDAIVEIATCFVNPLPDAVHAAAIVRAPRAAIYEALSKILSMDPQLFVKSQEAAVRRVHPDDPQAAVLTEVVLSEKLDRCVRLAALEQLGAGADIEPFIQILESVPIALIKAAEETINTATGRLLCGAATTRSNNNDVEYKHMMLMVDRLRSKDDVHAALFSLENKTIHKRVAAAMKFARLRRIEFSPYGDLEADFVAVHKIVRRYAGKAPQLSQDVKKALKQAPFAQIKERCFSFKDVSHFFKSTKKRKIGDGHGPGVNGLEGANVQVYGRTIAIETSSGQRLNIKLEKASEARRRGETPSLSPLCQEWRMNHAMQDIKKCLGLESEQPISLLKGPIWLTDIPDDLLKEIDSQSRRSGSNPEFSVHCDNNRYLALVYEPPIDYHVYLNDPTMEPRRFREASRICLADAARKTGAGLYDLAPTDLFHNEESCRTFVWFADSIAQAGRLDRWRKAVASVNFRASGKADYKHSVVAGELIQRLLGHGLNNVVRFDHCVFEEDRTSQAYAHVFNMGNELFAWVLTCVDSWVSRSERSGESGVKSFDLARELEAGFVSFLSTYLGVDEQDAKELFVEGGVYFQRMAAQCRYFCTDEYVKDLSIGFIPAAKAVELFGEQCVVDVAAVCWNQSWTSRGWMNDAVNPDLGPFSGFFPLQEVIRVLHITTALALCESNGKKLFL